MKAQKCVKYRLVIVIAASIIYGSLIEIAQALFTTTRKADILDIVANSVGTAGGCVAIYVTRHFARKMI
jgi:VanZ family protein